jgi:hypothetical protein
MWPSEAFSALILLLKGARLWRASPFVVVPNLVIPGGGRPLYK